MRWVASGAKPASVSDGRSQPNVKATSAGKELGVVGKFCFPTVWGICPGVLTLDPKHLTNFRTEPQSPLYGTTNIWVLLFLSSDAGDDGALMG